jgi:hypothetical protein
MLETLQQILGLLWSGVKFQNPTSHGLDERQDYAVTQRLNNNMG